MKKFISIMMIILCLGSLTGCKEDKNPVKEPEKISSLIGTWREIIDENRETMWYEITVTEDSITIYDCRLTRRNLWEGDFADPTEPVAEYSYDSTRVPCTDFDNWYEPDVRTFTYADGVLSVKKISGMDRDISMQPYIRCKKLEDKTT